MYEGRRPTRDAGCPCCPAPSTPRAWPPSSLFQNHLMPRLAPDNCTSLARSEGRRNPFCSFKGAHKSHVYKHQTSDKWMKLPEGAMDGQRTYTPLSNRWSVPASSPRWARQPGAASLQLFERNRTFLIFPCWQPIHIYFKHCVG